MAKAFLPKGLHITGLSELKLKIEKTRRFFVSFYDTGGARFSLQAARDFSMMVKTNILTGKFNSQFAPAKDKYQYMKRMGKGYIVPWGVYTGEMVENIEHFRTRHGQDHLRRGWVVGIKGEKMSDYYAGPIGQKLTWFEEGTVSTGKARPIMKLTLDEFMLSNFPSMFNKYSTELSEIWRR
jgi:hypothetical protein